MYGLHRNVVNFIFKNFIKHVGKHAKISVAKLYHQVIEETTSHQNTPSPLEKLINVKCPFLVQ